MRWSWRVRTLAYRPASRRQGDATWPRLLSTRGTLRLLLRRKAPVTEQLMPLSLIRTLAHEI